MKYQSDPAWFHWHLENESVFRTSLAHRFRTVHQKRSTWQVFPASLPHATCCDSGMTAA